MLAVGGSRVAIPLRSVARLEEFTADQVAQYAVPRLSYEVLFLDIFTVTPAPPRTAGVDVGAAFEGPAGSAERTPRPRAPRRR